MGSRTETGRPRARRTHAFLRDAATASASLVVVALLVAYALAAPSAKLTASVGPVVARPGQHAVVEGRVLAANGDGLSGASVDVRRGGLPAATTTSDDEGAFRVRVRGGCAAYTVRVQAETQGSEIEAAATRRLCPGESLPIAARVVTQGHFLWVPGPR